MSENSVSKHVDRLEGLRFQIDAVDDKIIELLETRFAIVNSIERRTLTDKQREAFILEKTKNPFIRNIYIAIFKNSKKARKHQKTLFSSIKKWFKFPTAS